LSQQWDQIAKDDDDGRGDIIEEKKNEEIVANYKPYTLNGISKYGWWLNELETLGIKTERRNEFNDLKEISNLTENVKQELYQYYKDAYKVYNTDRL
jgi:hypothetical protein